MAVVLDPEEPVTPVAPGDAPDIPTGAAGASPFTPAALPAGYIGPIAPSGMVGKARFDWMMQRAPSRVFDGPEAYRQYLASLPNDPNDPEYQRLVDEARKGGLTGIDDKLKDPFALTKKPIAVQGVLPPGVEVAAGGRVGEADAETMGAGGTGMGIDDTGNFDIKKGHGQDADQIRRWQEKPVFVGGPTENETGLDKQGDPWVARYNEQNGVQVSPDVAAAGSRSGNFVYMGTETHPDDPGASRDVWMYSPNAKAEIFTLDPGLISEYQAGLGLVVTGRPDSKLTGIWDFAVEQAQRAAMAGQKVSVRELFDIYVGQAMAALKASGGGGGGGGSRLSEDDAEDQVAVDYYRGMMSVLGDISGLA